MISLIKRSEKPGDIGLSDIDEPLCGDCDIKVQIQSCGICATDIHIMHGQYPWKQGVPLGHEYSGIVTSVGAKVGGFKAGDRITGCGSGGFAKYVVVNENDLIFKLPDNLSFEEGALMEPLAACTHAVLDNSEITAADVVLISGPGSIGLCAMQVVKAVGGRAIMAGTTSDKSRLALAEHLGADRVVDVQNENLDEVVMELTNGRGADAVLECSGSQAAVDSGLKLVKSRGSYTQIGLLGKRALIDLDSVVYRGLKINSSIGYEAESWRKSIELTGNGKIDVKSLISHKLPLSEWERGFDVCMGKEGLKVILQP